MQNHISPPTKISGIDVSAYQGNIDWQRVKQAGIKFVFAKSTEGANFKDKDFSSNILKASDAGLICGAYHFFRPKVAVSKQVDNFVNSVRSTGINLLPALDIEVPEDWKEIPRDNRIKLIVEWMDQVKFAIKAQPIIYLSSSFPGDMLSNTDLLSHCPLWLAHYTALPAPSVPHPWKNYTFWQHSDKGSVNGIKGNVDLNWFNGSVTELEQFVRDHQTNQANEH